MAETEKVPHVYTAIAEVQEALAKEGINKAQKNQQQGYNFRGIDDIYAGVSPLLAPAGLVLIPRVLDRTVTERQTQKGNALFYVTVKVEYDLVSKVDGSKHTACMVGEAMDSADKATNKAMSAAYKYLCIELFCIPIAAANDADNTTADPIRANPIDKTGNRSVDKWVHNAVADLSACTNLKSLQDTFAKFWIEGKKKKCTDDQMEIIKYQYDQTKARLEREGEDEIPELPPHQAQHMNEIVNGKDHQ